MTLTKQIEKLLAAGAPMGTADLMDATGKTREQIEQAIRVLKAGGRVVSIPVHVRYQLTGRGVKSAQTNPKSHEEKKAVKRAQYHEKKKRERSTPDIWTAIQARPALATVWG